MMNKSKILNEFLEQIHQIEKNLSRLENDAYDISKLYGGHSFSEQEELSVDLENRLISITHEVGSEIGFLRDEITTLANFINFREKHNIFSDNELYELLDTTLSMEHKKQLAAKCGGMECMLKQIAEIQNEWNKLFKNVGYAKQKDRLRLK